MSIPFLRNDPKEIISRIASKEFAGCKINHATYLQLQKSIVRALEKSKNNIKEIKIETEEELEYLTLHDFSRFVSTRLGMYACFIAIIAIIASNKSLVSQFGIFDLKQLISVVIIFGIIITASLRITEDFQKERTMYLKFLLRCIGILESKSNAIAQDLDD